MMQGEFPSELKKAVVKPTLKKKDADPDCLKNYRPVSNLPVVSKLLERIVLDQLNSHLQTNNLHCPVQSGYRPNHSCETLLVRMTDDIFREIHADNIVIVVLLDLSAAFDTIDHKRLLKKLENDFGITGSALNWFKSYLKDRSFGVKIDVSISNLLCLLFGVPQGSLLGPILFILYIKQLQKIAEKYGLSIQLYADDSQLYISFHPMRPTELCDITARINNCLSEIKSWMIENFMKLNESKTELLVMGKPLVLKKHNLEVKIQFGDTTITPTICKGDSWKSLGVPLDASLNMERQVNNVKQKCSWDMTNLRTIRRYLDEKVKLMLIKQLIISKLDYCNALYMNLTKTRLRKLKSALNTGVRFIYDITDMNVDLTPYYKKAHILPIEQRIFFKVCLLCFKVVNGVAPVYLQELVTMNSNDPTLRESRLRPADVVQMKLPKISKLKATNRRFSNYAPEAWNSLPSRLRKFDNISIFKGQLKIFLFEHL
uniref:Reverse transcriptase domain-containing protein n=1 Tax=Gadus morhua TaxID=8049 RepID=A0A8C5C924_GADMO